METTACIRDTLSTNAEATMTSLTVISSRLLLDRLALCAIIVHGRSAGQHSIAQPSPEAAGSYSRPKITHT